MFTRLFKCLYKYIIKYELIEFTIIMYSISQIIFKDKQLKIYCHTNISTIK